MDKKMMKNIYHKRSYQMRRMVAITALSAIFLAACQSIPPPIDQMATSKSAINSALSAGGNEFAPLQLKSAMEKMETAERAMAEKNYVIARRLAEQAQADAQVAEAMARSGKAKKSADALQDSSRVLREELHRQNQ